MSTFRGVRALIGSTIRARSILGNVPTPMTIQTHSHHDGPPMPFDNMPFKIKNRFFATVFFAVFFGIGLWAPYLIIWYSMVKRTL